MVPEVADRLAAHDRVHDQRLYDQRHRSEESSRRRFNRTSLLSAPPSLVWKYHKQDIFCRLQTEKDKGVHSDAIRSSNDQFTLWWNELPIDLLQFCSEPAAPGRNREKQCKKWASAETESLLLLCTLTRFRAAGDIFSVDLQGSTGSCKGYHQLIIFYLD